MSAIISAVQTEIEQINTSWAALDQVVGPLGDKQLTDLKRDRWSIQDHLIHIALAEQFVVTYLGGQPLHELFGTNKETFLNSSDDELNELGYQRFKSLSPQQAREMRRDAHRQLLDSLARLTDDDLKKAYAPYGTEMAGVTMMDILRANTYPHYDTHRGWIEEMIKQE